MHVRKSFEFWNPGWEVRALDEQSLPDVLGDYCKQFTHICKAVWSTSDSMLDVQKLNRSLQAVLPQVWPLAVKVVSDQTFQHV